MLRQIVQYKIMVAEWFYDPATLGMPYIPIRAELPHLALSCS